MKQFYLGNTPYANETGSITEALRSIYGNQGEMYWHVYGISYSEAYESGWHPDDRDFSRSCNGFERFMDTKGMLDQDVEKMKFRDYDPAEIKARIEAELFK